MLITAKVYLEHDRLALVPTLQRVPDIYIRVVTRGTTNPGGSVFPFVIEHDDRKGVERSLATDPTVRSYELVDWADGTGIYYIEHTPETKLISSAVTTVNGCMIHTETKRNGWLAHLLLPDREALNDIWEYANENDITFEILEIYDSDTGNENSYGLTDAQRTALTVAYEKGYFGEPRNISLSEVAAELSLSSTAMSGRLRRGMRNLIGATLAEEDEV